MVKAGAKLILICLSLSSCAFFKEISKAPEEPKIEVKNKFRLKDESGEYKLSMESGPGKENKTFVVKRKLQTKDDKKSKTLEKSISISSKEENGLTPKISQFSVWYNKYKHFSQIELQKHEKQLKVTWESPDPKFNGIKYFPIKDEKRVICFFTQVLDCAKYHKFLKGASKGDENKLDMTIIWDGTPFFQQQFINFNPPIMSSAVLHYDGKNKRGHKRFSLKVEGESIFYFIDDKYKMMGLYWIAKGLTIERLN